MIADLPPAQPQVPVVHVRTPGRIGGNDVTGRMRLPGFRGRVSIDVRGGWSRNYPKLSYNVELQDAEGENRNERLLGMPSDDDWVLYASWNDRTFLRNVLAYETARRMGRWAARTRHVELRLNGRYHGVYVLMEKPKVLDERVPAGDDGFLLEWTSPGQARRAGQPPYFRSAVTRTHFLWNDPEPEDLERRARVQIRRRVDRAERALYRGAPGAWRRHIHAPAAVDYAIVNELFKNQDAMKASTFMWAPEPGRALQLGPVWDFDHSVGKSNWGPARVLPGWMLDQRPWTRELYRDAAFRRALGRRWRELRRDGLQGRLLRSIAAHGRQLGTAPGRDARRWPARGEREGGTRQAHVRELRRWLRARIAWIDRNV